MNKISFTQQLFGGKSMRNRNFTNLGDEIKDIVQNAVNTTDFHRLNKDIGNSVNNALDEVRRAIGINQNSNQNIHQNINQNRYRQPNRRNNYSDNRTHIKIPYVQKEKVNPLSVPIGKTSGILLTVFGMIGMSSFGIAIFVLSIIGFVTNNFTILGSIALGLSPLFLGSILMAVKGSKIRKRLKRFGRYLSYMRGRNYCSIQGLSSHLGLSEKFIVKDLRTMILIGMFPQGHIDEQKTSFMLTNEVYDEYLRMQNYMRTQNLENQQKQNEEQKEKQKEEQSFNHSDSANSEFTKTIEMGRSYIRKIKEANDAIPGEEISNKLYHLETVTDKIFIYIESHQDQYSEIQKFMEYYLPTTLKLLNAYIEFDNQPVQGENISTAKKEIEETLDTINLAFEKLLDSLFEAAAMDISTDITVLETLLAQEGLTNKDFNKQ